MLPECRQQPGNLFLSSSGAVAAFLVRAGQVSGQYPEAPLQ
jgi:hypothetical protein